jgi:hypothetical protein
MSLPTLSVPGCPGVLLRPGIQVGNVSIVRAANRKLPGWRIWQFCEFLSDCGLRQLR